MNDNLPLVRVQTVAVDGTPQDFDEILSHSRKEFAARGSAEDWQKHLDGIKNLGVLANQASEFEYKKNLTEGKTGIVQPDLISSKTIEESLLNVVTSPDTPKKKMLSLEKTDEKIKGLKVEFKRQELLKSPINPTASFPSLADNGHTPEQKVVTPESPKFPTASPAKSPNPSIKSKASSELPSPKFPTGSPAKKSSFEPDSSRPSVVKMEPKVVKVEPKVEKVEKAEPKAVKIEPPQVTKPSNSQSSVKTATKDFITSEQKTSVPAEVKPADEPTKPKPINLPPAATPKPQEPVKLPASKSSHSLRRKKPALAAVKPPNVLVYSESVTTRDNVIKTLGTILKTNTYTIYPLTVQQVRDRVWLDNAALLVVCGSINGSDLGPIFLDFFFNGGKLLCLCSDLLRHVLPTYHTAEVGKLRETSTGSWRAATRFRSAFPGSGLGKSPVEITESRSTNQNSIISNFSRCASTSWFSSRTACGRTSR